MRSLLVVTILAACSSSSRPARPAAGLVLFVPDNAMGIAAWRPRDLPILSIIDRPPEMFRCWRALEQKIEVAYQVFTADKSSFVVLAGDLPRAEVQPCLENAFIYSRLLKDDLRDEGGQLVIDTQVGRVDAGWRDGFVVIGRPADVTRALASKTPSEVWAAAIEELPGKDELRTHALLAISRDLTFAGLVGVRTSRWSLQFDLPPRDWPTKTIIESGADPLEKFGQEQQRIAERKKQGLPPEPPDAGEPPAREREAPTFRGRLELRYASAADAKRAAEIFTTRTFAFEQEENLALALSKLPQKLAGDTLTLEFTQDSFPGVELAKLQAWIARISASH